MADRHITDSGRVDRENDNYLTTGANPGGFANDSIEKKVGSAGGRGRKRPYVTSARVEVLRSTLTPRNWQVISDVARLGIASGNQMRRLHYPDTPSGQRMARLELATLCQEQVLSRLGRTVGGVRAGSRGYLFTLGVAGQRLAWSGQYRARQPWTPGASYVRHALAVSELYVQLRSQATAELMDYDTEPQCWRRFAGAGGAPKTLKPDAYAVLELGEIEESFFIEMDCATESTTRITDKAKAYVRYWQAGREQARHDVFPWVLWISPDEDREAQLIEALARLPAEHWKLFRVTTMVRAFSAHGTGQSR